MNASVALKIPAGDSQVDVHWMYRITTTPTDGTLPYPPGLH